MGIREMIDLLLPGCVSHVEKWRHVESLDFGELHGIWLKNFHQGSPNTNLTLEECL